MLPNSNKNKNKLSSVIVIKNKKTLIGIASIFVLACIGLLVGLFIYSLNDNQETAQAFNPSATYCDPGHFFIEETPTPDWDSVNGVPDPNPGYNYYGNDGYRYDTELELQPFGESITEEVFPGYEATGQGIIERGELSQTITVRCEKSTLFPSIIGRYTLDLYPDHNFINSNEAFNERDSAYLRSSSYENGAYYFDGDLQTDSHASFEKIDTGSYSYSISEDLGGTVAFREYGTNEEFPVEGFTGDNAVLRDYQSEYLYPAILYTPDASAVGGVPDRLLIDALNPRGTSIAVINQGESDDFVVSVTNDAAAVTGYSSNITLPSALGFSGAGCVSDNSSLGTCTVNGSDLTLNIVSLNNGETVNYTISIENLSGSAIATKEKLLFDFGNGSDSFATSYYIAEDKDYSNVAAIAIDLVDGLGNEYTDNTMVVSSDAFYDINVANTAGGDLRVDTINPFTFQVSNISTQSYADCQDMIFAGFVLDLNTNLEGACYKNNSSTGRIVNFVQTEYGGSRTRNGNTPQVIPAKDTGSVRIEYTSTSSFVPGIRAYVLTTQYDNPYIDEYHEELSFDVATDTPAINSTSGPSITALNPDGTSIAVVDSGNNHQFDVVVTNNSAGAYASVPVTATLPQGLIFNGSGCTSSDIAKGTCLVSGQDVTGDVTLAIGESVTFTIDVQHDSANSFTETQTIEFVVNDGSDHRQRYYIAPQSSQDYDIAFKVHNVNSLGNYVEGFVNTNSSSESGIVNDTGDFKVNIVNNGNNDITNQNNNYIYAAGYPADNLYFLYRTNGCVVTTSSNFNCYNYDTSFSSETRRNMIDLRGILNTGESDVIDGFMEFTPDLYTESWSLDFVSRFFSLPNSATHSPVGDTVQEDGVSGSNQAEQGLQYLEGQVQITYDYSNVEQIFNDEIRCTLGNWSNCNNPGYNFDNDLRKVDSVVSGPIAPNPSNTYVKDFNIGVKVVNECTDVQVISVNNIRVDAQFYGQNAGGYQGRTIYQKPEFGSILPIIPRYYGTATVSCNASTDPTLLGEYEINFFSDFYDDNDLVQLNSVAVTEQGLYGDVGTNVTNFYNDILGFESLYFPYTYNKADTQAPSYIDSIYNGEVTQDTDGNPVSITPLFRDNDDIGDQFYTVGIIDKPDVDLTFDFDLNKIEELFHNRMFSSRDEYGDSSYDQYAPLLDRMTSLDFLDPTDNRFDLPGENYALGITQISNTPSTGPFLPKNTYQETISKELNIVLNDEAEVDAYDMEENGIAHSFSGVAVGAANFTPSDSAKYGNKYCESGSFIVESVSPMYAKDSIDLTVQTYRGRAVKKYMRDVVNNNFYINARVRCEQGGLRDDGVTPYHQLVAGTYELEIPLPTSNELDDEFGYERYILGPSTGETAFNAEGYSGDLDQAYFTYFPSPSVSSYPFTEQIEYTVDYSDNLTKGFIYQSWFNIVDDCYISLSQACSLNTRYEDYNGAFTKTSDSFDPLIPDYDFSAVSDLKVDGLIDVTVQDPTPNGAADCYPGNIQQFDLVDDEINILYNGNDEFVVDIMSNDDFCLDFDYSFLDTTYIDGNIDDYDRLIQKNLANNENLTFTIDDSGATSGYFGYAYLEEVFNSTETNLRQTSTDPIYSTPPVIIYDVNTSNTTYPRTETYDYTLEYLQADGTVLTDTATITVNVDIQCGGPITMLESNLVSESASALEGVRIYGNILFNDVVQASSDDRFCALPNFNIDAFTNLTTNATINGQAFDPYGSDLTFTSAEGHEIIFDPGTGNVEYFAQSAPASVVDTWDYTIGFDYTFPDAGSVPATIDPSCTQDSVNTLQYRCESTATLSINLTAFDDDLYEFGGLYGIETVTYGETVQAPDYPITVTAAIETSAITGDSQALAGEFIIDPGINSFVEAYRPNGLSMSVTQQPDNGYISCSRNGTFFECDYIITEGTPEGDYSAQVSLSYTDPNGVTTTRLIDVPLQVVIAEKRICLNGGDPDNNCEIPETPPSGCQVNCGGSSGGGSSAPEPPTCGPGTSVVCSSSSTGSPGTGYTPSPGAEPCNSFSCSNNNPTPPADPQISEATSDYCTLDDYNTTLGIFECAFVGNDFLAAGTADRYGKTLLGETFSRTGTANPGVFEFCQRQSDNAAAVCFAPGPDFFVQAEGFFFAQPGNNPQCAGDLVSVEYLYPFQPGSPGAEVLIDCSGRVLDCRLPNPLYDPQDPAQGPEFEAVSPIIVPDYVDPTEFQTFTANPGFDIFGLAQYSGNDLLTIKAPARTLYGDGQGGYSNSQNALYQQPLEIVRVNNDHANSKDNAVGANIVSFPGWVGRPMDIATVNYGTGTDVYVYGIRFKGSVDPQTAVIDVDEDVQFNALNNGTPTGGGDLEGFLVQVDITNGTFVETATNLPIGGFAKDFGDIAAGSTVNDIFLDDIRTVFGTGGASINEYGYIYNLVSGTVVEPTPTNSFYDVATADTGDVVSLRGTYDANVLPQQVTDRNQMNFNDQVLSYSSNPATLDVIWDGGDVEINLWDDTYAVNELPQDVLNVLNVGYQHIYYSAGEGTQTEPAIVRIDPRGGSVSSNQHPADANFTSATTGYMDKMIFQFSDQIIYYKNGARSFNDPDQTIGKIYCPEVVTPPYVPTNPPTPGAPQDNPPYGNNGGGGNGGAGNPPAGGGGGSGSSTGTGNPTTPPQQFPEIQISKSANQTGLILPGSAIIYTVTVENTGNLAATNVVVTDQLDPDLVFSGVATCTGDATNCVYNPVTRTLSWTLPSVAAGATYNLNFQATSANYTP